jgi:hypothetical protein
MHNSKIFPQITRFKQNEAFIAAGELKFYRVNTVVDILVHSLELFTLLFDQQFWWLTPSNVLLFFVITEHMVIELLVFSCIKDPMQLMAINF